MGLPISTTRITVWRTETTGTEDAFDRPEPTVIVSGVPAVIGAHNGVETSLGGSSQTRQARLDCEPIDLRHDDTVVDDTTGETWHVIWCTHRIAFGFDHTVADIIAVTDRAAA